MKMCVSEVPAMGVQKPEVVSGIVWNIYFVSVSKNQYGESDVVFFLQQSVEEKAFLSFVTFNEDEGPTR